MTSSSHLAGSAVFYLAASALFDAPISVHGLAATAVGSLLPDIDTPTSSVGRPLFPLARWINERVGHRTLTHSLIGMTGFTLLAVGLAHAGIYLNLLSEDAVQTAWLMVLGYLSHIIIDTLNPTGVELFWPSRLRCVFFLGPKYRIASAGAGDYWFMVCSLAASFALYPVARDGFTLSVHRFFGDVYSVSTDYRLFAAQNRIWMHLEGVDGVSSEPVTGRFEILAAVDNAAVLIEREPGLKQIVSRTRPLQIFPHKTTMEIGEQISVETVHFDMAGRTLSELPRFPGAQRALYYGYLIPARRVDLAIRQDRFEPIVHSLNTLRFNHAEYLDVVDQSLQAELIREGTLLVRVVTVPGAEPAESPGPNPGPKLQLVTLELKPEHRLLIAPGDDVIPGQVIARRELNPEEEAALAAVEFRIDSIQRDLEAARRDRLRLQVELTALRLEREDQNSALNTLAQNPLLLKELQRLQTRSAETAAKTQMATEKLESAAAHIRNLESRLQSETRLLHLTRQAQTARAEIRSGFAGRVERIERRGKGETVAVQVVVGHYNPLSPPTELIQFK